VLLLLLLCVCMLLLLLCVPCRQAPTPPLLSVMVYALPQTHSILGYCGTLSCVVCTLLSSGCWGSLCLLLLLQYVPCRHLVMTTVPSLQERACKVSATPPPPGGGLLLTSLLCPCRVCVFTGNFMRAVRVCSQSTVFAGPGAIFLRAGALRAYHYVLLHP